MATRPTGSLEVRGVTQHYAQTAIPGQTEPMGVATLTIPMPPPDGPASGNPGQSRPTTQTAHQQQKLRARARLREQSLILSEVDRVEFKLYSTSEIDDVAVVVVNNPESHGPGSVRDLRMGPHNESQLCDTCSNDIRGCPGHYGRINIPRLMHPLAINTIILVLGCVCNSCGGLLVSREEIERAGINRLREEKRLQAIKNLIKTPKCRRFEGVPGVRQCDPQPEYKSYRDYAKDKTEYRLPYSYPGKAKGTVFFRAPDVPFDSPENSIYKILNAITDEDAATLGFTDTHPRNMIIERLVVIPYCARPDLYQGDKLWPDDLTSMYQDIVKKVRSYNDAGNNEALRETELREINFRITRLMKNDGKYTQGGVKVYVDVKKRIQGKTAIVRANIMGKRVNFAGRTVVGPGAYLRVDEVGIPRLMATKLTRPIRVTDYNKEELQAKYDNNKVMHITMQGGPLAGQRAMVNDTLRQKFPDYQLNTGDIVERMLEDGDLVLINRQPTLHKQNILACYAKIIDDRVVRINLSVTSPLNADFDGGQGQLPLVSC
jgi:DNA-directed RNA polymerase beta' subunit